MIDTTKLKKLLIGSDIGNFKQEAKELYSDLPDDAFILYLHQGYCFSYVRESESPDYPVYFYCEGDNKSKLTHISLEEFIKELELQINNEYINR